MTLDGKYLILEPSNDNKPFPDFFKAMYLAITEIDPIAWHNKDLAYANRRHLSLQIAKAEAEKIPKLDWWSIAYTFPFREYTGFKNW